MPLLGTFGAGSGKGFGQGGGSFVGMTATGGTITESGDYRIHTFTSPGTFEVTEASTDPTANEVEYLIVAGGGGHGYGYGSGGGAGGYRAAGCGPAPLQASNAPTPVASYPIVIGGGGAVGPQMPVGPYSPASSGSPSSAISLTAAGGGAGMSSSSPQNGTPGGSGSGATGGAPGGSATAGSGNVPPVSPPQGNAGEPAAGNPEGTQGGGAGAAGSFPRTNVTGVTNSIDGTPKKYACGGNSGSISPRPNSGFGGTDQQGPDGPGSSGIVVIRYRVA
tara:strand:- start:338 stop:1168 length:831 start_codon:yes stop_codon:yes gene_type:complete